MIGRGRGTGEWTDIHPERRRRVREGGEGRGTGWLVFLCPPEVKRVKRVKEKKAMRARAKTLLIASTTKGKEGADKLENDKKDNEREVLWYAHTTIKENALHRHSFFTVHHRRRHRCSCDCSQKCHHPYLREELLDCPELLFIGESLGCCRCCCCCCCCCCWWLWVWEWAWVWLVVLWW